jgi:hypothetical protein
MAKFHTIPAIFATAWCLHLGREKVDYRLAAKVQSGMLPEKLLLTRSAGKLRKRIMAVVALAAPMLIAAVGYSLLYLLMGGGLGGAILIFIVAKMLGK